MADSPVPPISKGLVEWLSRLFPDRCPEVTTPPRKVWMAAGAAEVVRKLKHELDNQTQRALEKT